MAEYRTIRGFSNRLENAIFKSGLDIGEVASRSQITRSMLWSYLYDGKSPNSYNLMKLSVTLNVTSDWLLGISNNRTLDPCKAEITEHAMQILSLINSCGAD